MATAALRFDVTMKTRSRLYMTTEQQQKGDNCSDAVRIKETREEDGRVQYCDNLPFVVIFYSRSIEIFDAGHGAAMGRVATPVAVDISAARLYHDRFLVMGSHDYFYTYEINLAALCDDIYTPLKIDQIDAGTMGTCIAHDKIMQRIIVGRYSCVVDICNLQTQQRLLRMEGHERFISFVDFMDEPDRALSTSYDGTLHVWDTTSGACIDGVSIERGISFTIRVDDHHVVCLTTNHTVVIFKKDERGRFGAHTTTLTNVANIFKTPDGDIWCTPITEDYVRILRIPSGDVETNDGMPKTTRATSIAFRYTDETRKEIDMINHTAKSARVKK